MSESHNPEMSGLRFYSFGRAANNKALNSKELQVTPIEQLSMLDGELISLPFDSEVTGQTAGGAEYGAKVILDTALTATWFPLSSNRTTAPDVRRGERVLIWRYKDTDQYYWTETGWDDHLRRLETVHYRFSATTDEAADMEDASNYYHLQISTHEGMIHVETSNKNKEKAVYAIQINTKDGLIVVTDDHGNFLQLESVAKIWSMQNGDGSLWQLNKKVIYGYAPDKIHMIAENLIHMQTKRFHLECETGHVDATEKFSFKTPLFEVESNQNMFKTPNTTFTGNVSIGNSLGVATSGSGSAIFQGPCTFQQTATFQQQTTFQQRINANGIISSAPIQGPSDTI